MSAKDFVIQKAMSVQSRTGDVASASRDVSGAAHDMGTRIVDVESENRMTRVASDTYNHAKDVGSDISDMLLARLRKLSDVAVKLYETADTMEDVESASRILDSVMDSIGRLKNVYRHQLDEATKLASEKIKEFSDTNLFSKKIFEARSKEVGDIKRDISAAVEKLNRMFVDGLSRSGVNMESLRDRSKKVFDFDSDFSGRFGTVNDLKRSLSEQVDSAEARIAEFASIPGSYGQIAADTKDVYSGEELGELNRRLDEML